MSIDSTKSQGSATLEFAKGPEGAIKGISADVASAKVHGNIAIKSIRANLKFVFQFMTYSHKIAVVFLLTRLEPLSDREVIGFLFADFYE